MMKCLHSSRGTGSDQQIIAAVSCLVTTRAFSDNYRGLVWLLSG